MSLSDLLPELFLLTSAPMVKTAGRPEGPLVFALSPILFCHLEWPPSKLSLVHSAWRHPACPSTLISTTTSRKPSLTSSPASHHRRPVMPGPQSLEHSTGSPLCSILMCVPQGSQTGNLQAECDLKEYFVWCTIYRLFYGIGSQR